MESKLHIVMFPWFAYGHINPFIHLSNKLTSHGIQISFLSIPGNIDRIESSLNTTPPNQLIPLTIPPTEGLSSNFDSSSDITPKTAELLKVALDQMQPQIKTLLSQLRPHIIVFDFAQYWLPSIAFQLGIKAVNYCVFPAVAASYLTIPARITDPNKQPTVDDLKYPPPDFPETSSIKSVKTFQAREFLYLFKSFNDGPSAFTRINNFIKSCDATIYKTCTEIEGPYIDYLKTQIKKPLLLAGPVAPPPPPPPLGILEQKWETWLGKFPEKSVIFCNFGSEAKLNNDEIRELTLGLELTGLPFILVLNFGTSGVEAQNKLDSSLPQGFRERIKDRGVVHTGWVQQKHILAHKSIGCHLSHCGFSSVIEGIVNDCQLVFLPQMGDQFLNVQLFSGDLKIGVEVNTRDEDGFFGKEDILEAINTVMVYTDKDPGKTFRKNHSIWKKFFLDKDIDTKYTANLIKELQVLAQKPTSNLV